MPWQPLQPHMLLILFPKINTSPPFMLLPCQMLLMLILLYNRLLPLPLLKHQLQLTLSFPTGLPTSCPNCSNCYHANYHTHICT
jgi:hypothetical protein